ncbi:DUF4349 domain-containing protein [Clostridium sp. YIM B02505]|uniref:DUF4349 domain-containing protein n=1 Tax=Clostridium yunnanense TaxID=2800325 RepID=A0ABS1ELT1_9CLOT|nr:DUF4349 domain-containing protein [Clostridium yunnanense]MBK1810353.1 DUF4349 domain-containing protein [Clostridium yunnanense]
MRKKVLFKIVAALIISSSVMLTSCSSSKKDMGTSKSSSSAPQSSNDGKLSVTSDEAAKAKNSTVGQANGAENGAGTDQSKSNADSNEKNDVKAAEQRKIIKSGELTIQSLKFDESISSITKAVEKLGGYIENSSIDGKKTVGQEQFVARNAKLQVKIPKDKFDGFISDTGNYGTVIFKSIKGEDITSSYFDTEARVNSLKVQEERLLELLKKSGSLKDVFEIEQQLSNIRYQIESLTGNLKKWDNLVEFSSLTININEVEEIKAVDKAPKGFGEKLVYNFKQSIISLGALLKGFVLIIASALPYLVILSGIAFVGLKVYKRVNKIKEDKNV